MADLAIITAITDGYDTLKPAMPQEGLEVEWVCVTDGKPLDGLEGWTVIPDLPADVHPNRAAKRPKLMPWEYTDAPASIWVDASFRVVSPRFAVEAGDMAMPIAQFGHPWRDCLYDEADLSEMLTKYQGEPLAAQARYYRERGHPAHWGLWAAGVIARRHTDSVKELGRVWNNEVEKWSFQDQVSQPYALRQVGLIPSKFPGTHMATPWLSYEGSWRHN